MARLIAAALGALLVSASWDATAKPTHSTAVDARRVLAHETFLAGEELRGRASATRDEAIAAAYVATQFRLAGLVAPPGIPTFMQQIPLLRQKLTGEPVLAVGGQVIDRAYLVRGVGGTIRGRALVGGGDGKSTAKAKILIVEDERLTVDQIIAATRASEAELVIAPAHKALQGSRAVTGASPLPTYPLGAAPGARSTLITLPADRLRALAAEARRGTEVTLAVPFDVEQATTTNAIGFLPGTDPDADVILVSAHLDHFGRRPDGVVLHGANDDASGVVAVLELARALADGPRPRRGVLFATYGSEEIGGLGSRHFAEQPPIPLARISANLQFEMIGFQDPKLPQGSLMMTGFERSTLGPMLRAAGARVAADPYPEQRFFERSDNYALALKGVVAHTLSGWTGPTYHQPSDTIATLDIPFMTRAIGSLVEPIRRIANGQTAPRWNPKGRPRSS